jgi:apolipoprotein N-acyltransferase
VSESATNSVAEQPPVALPPPSPLAPAVSRRVAYALGFASGTLYFLGFAATERIFGFPLWWCSLVALAPMAVAMEGQSSRRCLEVGAIAGFTMNMMGFYWLHQMLMTFSGFGGVVSFIFMSVLCFYQGGRIGLFCWL